MKSIGIDIQATKGSGTGLAVYTRHLVEALSRESQNGLRFYFYDNPKKGELNTIGRLLWENLELPRLVRSNRLDLLHVPAFAPPFQKTCRTIVTVHDLIGMLFPNQLRWPSRFYWGKWLPGRVKSADALIADSEHTKRDLVERLGIHEKKITVIYPSGHEGFSPASDPQTRKEIKQRLGIRERYFLCVGTIEPRKNVARVIRAFGRFLKQTKNPCFQLVVVGSRQFAHGEVFRSLLREVILNPKDVCFTDSLDSQDLNLLYAGAEGLVFASLYEGFGIPPLEAMASGCPVIASNVSSVPEVTGEAAFLVDPYQEDEIARGMLALAEDSDLRKELIQKGFDRIKQFSWQKTARETLAVYQSLL